MFSDVSSLTLEKKFNSKSELFNSNRKKQTF
jgi:hypothetical protein